MPPFSNWSSSPNDLRLESDAIHVWRATLDCDSSVLHRLEAVLAPDEKSRAARYIFQRDRDHFIVARGILRTILGAYAQRSAADLTFTYEPEGKPALRLIGGEPSIRFNLSHSHGLAVYAFSNQREVGIDVEAIRPNIAEDEIAGRVFSASELAEFHALPLELKNIGFFHCWTRKEAYVKARGSGMGIPLDSFEVSLTPGQPEVLRSADSNRWSLRSLQPAPGYVGAVVGEGKGWDLRLWNWIGWNPTSGT
jgi:4'-phosphopantetheinyl transferase